jgi:glycosyltransferase involved in cell wall biosynthesis
MYLTTLITKMSEQQPKVEFVVLESQQFPLTELSDLPNVTRVVCRGAVAGRLARIAYQNSILPIILRRLSVHALLATCNVLPIGCPVPGVVVIQSLQYFDHHEAYGRLRARYLKIAVKHACRTAASLICVSQAARRDLIRLTGVSADKVTVIHHGISPALLSYCGDVRPSEPPYILCVATLYRYKNLRRLMEAFAQLRSTGDLTHRLRIVGGEADLTISELAHLARTLRIADHVDLVGPLPHERMAREYAGASAFVYPSLNETFGLPPLEAMAMGVPVVASTAPAVSEVVGDAAELVDPFSVADIARGLRRVLVDSRHTQALVQLGQRRASEFSWDSSARRTFSVIQSAVA